MHKSKLIKILQVLNSQEKEALKKWVQSPIHTQHEKSKELFLYLLSKRKWTVKTTAKATVYLHLFPKEKYNDKKLKYIMSYCVTILENFIEFLCNENNDFFNKKMLISYLNQHGLSKYAQQELKKLKATQQTQQIQDSAYFYNQYQLEKVIFEHKNIATRTNQTNLQAVLNNHYLAFVLDTLYYACEAITHQRLYKSVYEIPLLETILADIKKGKYQDIPAIQLYYYSYMTLSCLEEESYFQVLQNLLVEQYAALSRKEMKNIYLIAVNYCVRQLNSGIEKYVRTVFDLFQYGLEYNILVEEDKLNQFTYKNIVTAAIRLEEYDWTANFIMEYTPKLALEYQENYARFAKSKLYFAQKKYDACLQLLAQVDFDDLFLNMNAKSMLLKIYYERQYFEALDALSVSFRRFLQRKSIVSYQRNIYENMLNLTTKLLNIPRHDKKKIALLRAEIEGTNPLTEKPWLLAQLKKI